MSGTIKEEPRVEASAAPEAPRSLREQVMRGGAFMMVRQLVSMAFSLIGVLITTRVLGPDRYGPYAAALGIYLYVQSLGQVGIGVYLVRSPEKLTDREYHVASTTLLGLSLFLVTAVELSLGFVGAWVKVKGFEALLGTVILVLPLQTVAVSASARLEKALDFKRVALIEMSSQIFYYIVVLPLVLLTDAGVWALVTGWICQQTLACVSLHVAGRYMPRLAWDTALFRRMVGYSLAFSAANWIYQLRSLVNPLIVGHFVGDEGVGIVGIGIKLLDMLAFFKTIAWRLSVATLARIQHNDRKLLDAVTQGMQLQMLAIAPVLLGFGWVGPILLPMVFGERWLPVMTIYPYLALSYLTNAQFNVHSSVLYVRQRNWDVAWFHIAHVGLFAAGAWIAVQYVGIVGYGWGEALGVLGYIVLHLKVKRLIGSPDYRLPILWWVGTVIGLFWQSLGLWAIAAPFISLLMPQSIRQLRSYFIMVTGRKRAVPA